MSILKRFIGGLGGGDASEAERRTKRTTDQPPGSSQPEVDTLIRDGLLRYQAGDLQGAETAYRSALQNAPDHADAHYLLGGLLGELGHLDGALEHLQHSARLAPQLAGVRSDIGNVYRARGQLEDAEASYREAIAMDDDCVVAYRNLGDLLRQQERIDEAIECTREAAGRVPDDADLQFILADLLAARGRYLEATKSYRAGLRVAPGVAAAHNNLGASYRYLGRIDDAIECFEEALRLDPELADAHSNLADILDTNGSSASAMEHFRRAGELSRDAVHCRRRLGQMYLDRRRFEESVRCFREVLALEPEMSRSHFELGNALIAAGDVDEAMERFHQATRLDPENADAHVNLGFAYNKAKRFEEAAHCFRDALDLSPQLVEAHNNLGGVMQLQGRLVPAMQAYERALELAPGEVYIRSNLLTCMNYHADADPEEIYAQHLRWAESLDEVLAAAPAPQPRRTDPERRLRIGYVSADFRFHSVGFFIAPVIQSHDRSRFEIFCYSNVTNPDANTERLKEFADHWRDIAFQDDDEVAAWIRHDAIDVLVDLSGHTVGNRLPVFARRPAPVQVTYLGYPNTTGLATMDYRLTDERADPTGVSDKRHSERLVRLSHGFLCYQPLPSCPEIRAGTDTGEDDSITFASFNELLKVTPSMIAAWSEILRRTPGSRLLIKGTSLQDQGTRERVAGWFVEQGVEEDRLELIGRTPTLEEHLELYNRVDLALDTFPYNGTTTTCEALWMGVPVVSLVGEAHASRVSASLLPLVDLDDLATGSMQEYVDMAVSLSADKQRRQMLRQCLRKRMQESTLMDSRGFTRDVEVAYREMWYRACAVPGPRAAIANQRDHDVTVRINGGIDVRLPADLNQVTPYVLLEQEDWFEDEIHFARNLLGSGMRCLDIGANYGVFTLTCANSVGSEGRVWSFEPTPITARYLSSSIAENGFDNVTLMPMALSREPGSAKLVTHADSEFNYLADDAATEGQYEIVDVQCLDAIAGECGLHDIDFVKLDAEGAEIGILDGGSNFFESESPLILFELKYGDRYNWKLVDAFCDRGFDLYRLLPGLQILVPFERERLDAYQLNLFACKKDRAIALEAKGLLARHEHEGALSVESNAVDYRTHLSRRPFARGLVSSWDSCEARETGALPEELVTGLSLYCQAHQESSTPARRYTALNAAFVSLSTPQARSAEAARLHSLARVAWELGHRSIALLALKAIRECPGAGADTLARIPFVPVSAWFDDIEPGDAFTDWCLASVLDQRERLCAFSSYFDGARRLDELETLEQSRFQRAEMERRRQLVRIRQGLQAGPQPAPVLKHQRAGNLNPNFWMSSGAQVIGSGER